MNKKFLKALALVGCALLLVTASVVGTYAFLTAETGTIQNTFTAGNVTITLDEAKVDVYGVKIDETTRVSDKNEYKLIPGKNYTKDPTVTVVANSEACWVFVKVVNGIENIEATTKTIESQIEQNWTLIDDAKGIYAYNSKVASMNTDQKLVVFTDFTIADTATVSGYITASNSAAKITVTAYAVQADGFGTAEAAWAATFGAPPANP